MTAFCNPGYVNFNEQFKKSFSTSTNPPTPYSVEFDERIEAVPSSNSEYAEEKFQNLQDHNVNFERSSKVYVRKSEEPRTVGLQIDVSSSFYTERAYNRKSTSSIFLQNPKKIVHQVINEDQDDEKQEKNQENQENLKNNPKKITTEEDKYMSRFCIACNFDQPVRAKHCLACNKCVHKYDHHCT